MRKHLAPAIIRFFETEVRNEANGGVTPATLGSALDSFRQAPDEILFQWCGFQNVSPIDYSLLRGTLVSQIDELASEHGKSCTLSQLLY